MDADARRKPPASHPLPPPALFRARSGRVADLAAGVGAAFSGPPDTPPRRSLVSVPYHWEEAPGKPRAASPTAWAAATDPEAAANAAGPVPEGGDRHDSGGHEDLARPRPLKLPPRLQRVESFAAADTRQGPGSTGHADQAGPPRPLKLPPRLQQVPVPPSFAAADYATPSPSPNTVLQGPYSGGGGGGRSCKPPKWVRSGGAALKRTPSAGMALLSRTLSKRKAPPGAVAPAASGSGKNRGGGDHGRDAQGPDAPWYSPASSSSSSSVSTRFGADDQHGGRGRPADGREVSSEEEDDGSPRGLSVRITRFTRNRSLPNLTTSSLWASVRRSVKQITPILHGARSWATTRSRSSATQSGGSGESRMVPQAFPESSSRLHLEEFPFGEATGLPLIPCPDCGLARVVERRLMNETTKDHLRVFFKCPLNVSGFPKLCGFYKFQREYLDKLKELGIVRIRTSPAVEILDETTKGGDATSGYTEREMKVEANMDVKESKLDAKMEELLWKSNLLMFVFAVLLGGVFMYLVVVAK